MAIVIYPLSIKVTYRAYTMQLEKTHAWLNCHTKFISDKNIIILLSPQMTSHD